MTPPPPALDGATVLWWAWSGEQPFGVLPCTDDALPSIPIHGLAVATYDGVTFYRFSCDRAWVVQQDSDWESEEAALAAVPAQYRHVAVVWRPAPPVTGGTPSPPRR